MSCPRLALLVALAGGCALDAGGPFARLDAELDVRLVRPADRELGDGWQKLASDYEVTITRAEARLGPARLIDAGGAGGSFDPARPPPGYSLCHNGHCHAADGRLVPYEEVAAELAGGPAARVVVSLETAGEIDLLAGTARRVGCAPSCDLPLARVGTVRLELERLLLEGRVRDPRGRIVGEAPLRVELEDARLLGSLDLPADRAHAPDVRLTVRLELGVALLDLVELAADDVDVAARVKEAVEATPLQTTLTR
jgi:hypothetical protein